MHESVGTGRDIGFKWNEEQIKLNDVLKEFGKKPLLGDQRGKTRWILFMK